MVVGPALSNSVPDLANAAVAHGDAFVPVRETDPHQGFFRAVRLGSQRDGHLHPVEALYLGWGQKPMVNKVLERDRVRDGLPLTPEICPEPLRRRHNLCVRPNVGMGRMGWHVKQTGGQHEPQSTHHHHSNAADTDAVHTT